MEDFTARLRDRVPLIGYWIVLDSPVSSERIAHLGYDYMCVDVQHGMVDDAGMRSALLAIDSGGRSAGLVRVRACSAVEIGRALDSGARGVIVPLVNTPADARDAVRATRYPPAGIRSYGPGRSAVRIGPDPRASNEAVACIAMIETLEGYQNVESICAVEGLDAIYIGPSDLALSLGSTSPSDPEGAARVEAAIAEVREAAHRAGLPAGIHTRGADVAARRLDEGFDFVSVASDLSHLAAAAATHLDTVRTARPR